MRRPSFRVVVVVSLLAFSIFSFAQAPEVRSRIAQAVDEHQLITLTGNTHPLARTEFDQGAAPSTLPMQRMLLVLKRSSEQQMALTSLLDQQQDNSTITAWLQDHGFEVNKVANGRTVIEFSGMAGQVRDTFHTAIHKYVVKGEEHWANSSDLQLPAALAPVVAGVNTLHNFHKKPLHGISKRVPITSVLGPESTGTDGSHALVPGDYAV